jgi:DNA-binding response OmpR family regulator
MRYIKHNNLSISEDKNFVVLLGYKLALTKTEYLILKALAKSKSSPLSAEQISIQTSLELSKENVAYHIFNINAKAKLISNRTLIKNIAKTGYFLD